jgi:hypothetical protein
MKGRIRKAQGTGRRARGAEEEAQSTEHRAQGRRMVHGVRYAETKRWQKG